MYTIYEVQAQYSISANYVYGVIIDQAWSLHIEILDELFSLPRRRNALTNTEGISSIIFYSCLPSLVVKNAWAGFICVIVAFRKPSFTRVFYYYITRSQNNRTNVLLTIPVLLQAISRKAGKLKKKKHWVKGTEMPCLKTNGNQYYEQFMDYRKWQSNGQREVRLISTVSTGCSSSGCLALFVGMFDSLISRKPRPFWEFPLWNTEVWYLFFHQYIPWISASTLTWWKVRQIATCTKKIKPTFKT